MTIDQIAEDHIATLEAENARLIAENAELRNELTLAHSQNLAMHQDRTYTPDHL